MFKKINCILNEEGEMQASFTPD